MTVTFTKKAAEEVKRVMNENDVPAEAVLRMGVRGGGCSGLLYYLGFDNRVDPEEDELIEQHGVKLAVDKRSLLYLKGTVVDFYDGEGQQGFVFHNPNLVRTCSCASAGH